MKRISALFIGALLLGANVNAQDLPAKPYAQ